MLKAVEEAETALGGLRTQAIILLIGVGLGLFGGIGAGWKLWSSKAPKAETAAPAVRQADGSLILERNPDATANPAQQIPHGATVERVVQVTVQPRLPAYGEAPAPTGGTDQPEGGPPVQSTGTGRASVGPCPPCPPVRVDMSLIRLKDQTRRVIASSPDGDVVGGVDIPVESAAPARVFKWAAGGVYGASSGGGRSVGAFLHRDVAFLRVGAEATRDTFSTRPGEWSGRVFAGIRF